jgi:serine/threonine-protein kinase HipA
MITTAFIKLWNKRVGAIAWDSETETGSFEYDPNFLKLGLNPSPVKMPVKNSERKIYTFPELKNHNTFKGLPGLLADSLPDKYGNALINTWLAREGRSSNSLNPVELLCFIGTRGMGALEFEPVIPESNNTVSKIEINHLIEVAEAILSDKKKFNKKLNASEEKALLDVLKIGTSAGGARAKALIAYNTQTGEVKSGQANAPEGFTHWIIKFDGVNDSQFGSSTGYGRVEMAYYLMAKEAGIEMSECRLLEENNRAHFMTKRFDREASDKKIHLQSFCGLQHYDFNDVNLYSYEQLFETMRFLGLPYPQAEQLYRRMALNVMARNCDDHTKNFAFLMDESGNWKLSPAFDICHAYRPDSTWVSQHALSVNGKRKDISRADLLEVAKQMNVKKAEAILNQIATIVTHWGEYAKSVSVDKPLLKAIEKTLLVL